MSYAQPAAFESVCETGNSLVAPDLDLNALPIETRLPAANGSEEIEMVGAEAPDISESAEWSRYGLDERRVVERIVQSEPGTEFSRADVGKLLPDWLGDNGRRFFTSKLLAKMDKDNLLGPNWTKNGKKGHTSRYVYGPPTLVDGESESGVQTQISEDESFAGTASSVGAAAPVIEEPALPATETIVTEDQGESGETKISNAVDTTSDEEPIDASPPSPESGLAIPQQREVVRKRNSSKSDERFGTSAEELEDYDLGPALPPDPTARAIAANIRDFILGKGPLGENIFPEKEEDLPKDDAAYRSTIYAGMKVALWHSEYSADGCSERLADISHMLNSVPKRKASRKKASPPEAAVA